jgi:rhamnopyranosyl-N-acetylglucosaminyl-diphospho-decaprenol beta-1,3/1,4-galactofuranosyltransferase
MKSHINKIKIIAVVVTRNRIDLLKISLKAIRSQSVKLDQIIIVDNDSNDGTSEWLANQTDIEIIKNENTGGAGGFAIGIEKAIQLKADWVWLMDDDGYPDSKALEILLSKIQGDTASAWNSVVIPDIKSEDLSFGIAKLNTKNDPIFTKPIFKTQVLRKLSANNCYPWASFFNGSLVSIDCIKKAGNVNPGFFIWGDEVDFFMRLRKIAPIYTVLDAYHFHPKPNSQSMPNWKVFYALRNGIFISRIYFNHSYLRIVRLILIYGRILIQRFNFRLLIKAIREGFSDKKWNFYGLEP